MMASGKRKATSDDIVRKSKKIKLNGSDGVTDMYNSIDFTWNELTLNASYESDNEEGQINCGDESCDELHLYLEMGSDDESETATTSGPVTLNATSSELTEKSEVHLIHEVAPDATSSKRAETVCDELYVFLDTETSQICEKNGEILQIAAMTNRWIKKTFNQYIFPQNQIHKYASKINGLRKVKGSLQLQGKPVPSVKCQSALQNFLEYLDELRSLAGVPNVVLVAHHAFFDMKFLCKEFSKYHLWNELKARVSGIVDTLPIFRELYAGLESYKLVALAKIFAGEIMESAHNAMDDCEMLRNMSSLVIDRFPAATVVIEEYERKNLENIIRRLK